MKWWPWFCDIYYWRDNYFDTNNDINDDVVITWNILGKWHLIFQKIPSEKSPHLGGRAILNKCGTMLTRSKHQINGSNKLKRFLQKTNATSNGNIIPWLYPWNMIFNSISYITSGDNLSGLGETPISLMTQSFECLCFLQFLSM